MKSLYFAQNPMLSGVSRKDFMSHPGEAYVPVPLDLKIEEYFHTLSSVGTPLRLLQRLGMVTLERQDLLPRRSVGARWQSYSYNQ